MGSLALVYVWGQQITIRENVNYSDDGHLTTTQDLLTGITDL
jgi:hypothetical protein